MSKLQIEKAYFLDKEIKEKTAVLKKLKKVMYTEAAKISEGEKVLLEEEGFTASVLLSKTFDVAPTPDIMQAMNEGVLGFLSRTCSLEVPPKYVQDVVTVLADTGLLSKLQITDKVKVANREEYEQYEGSFLKDLDNCVKCKEVWRVSLSKEDINV